MRYLRFIVRNYRAVTGPLEIDVEKRSLIPIIGINESGKTTILQAIFAFDHYNDKLNENGRHLKDTSNLYTTSPSIATIEAHVSATRSEFIQSLEEEKNAALTPLVNDLKAKRSFAPYVTIVRNLKTNAYTIPTYSLLSPTIQDLVAKAIIKNLPYILYFDDFRDKFDEQIEITDPSKPPSGWLAILEQLFKRTDKSLSVFTLASLEDRQRKSVLSKVENHLNKTLTREWENFRLEDAEALQIAISFLAQAPPGQPQRNFLKLDVIETDASNDKHYFYVSDRSKGFYWFFNFVMKLEFNPKIISEDDKNTVYLLDEPGSYLHASAQAKLCAKLKGLSEKNRVVYCTHSHYLLDPEIIPFGNIIVADKSRSGSITVTPIHEYRGNISEKRSAFQPVVDALRVKPVYLDAAVEPVVITEGIQDYYAFQLFKASISATFMPSVGADSIKYYVSLMIALGIDFRAVWDNDQAGRKARADAEKVFGNDVASKFFTLPHPGRGNRILQDLFQGDDLNLIRSELGIPSNSSFDKSITALFYHKQKSEIVAKVSRATKDNFFEVFKQLQIE